MQVTSFRGSRTQLADRGFSFAIMPCDWPNYRPPLLAPRSSLLSPAASSCLNPLLRHFSPTPGLISPPLLARLIHLASNPLPPSPLHSFSRSTSLFPPSTPLLPVQQDCRPVGARPSACSLFRKKEKKKREGGEYLHLNFCKKHIKRQHGGDRYLDSTCVFFISLHAGKTGAHACFSFLSSPR